MDKLYEENKNLIMSFAHNLSRLTGINYHELESEGNEIFMKCCTEWEQKKSNGAKFSTYLSKTLYFDMYRYIRNIKKRRNREIELDEIHEPMIDAEFEQDTIVRITLESLSRDAKQCVALALDPPDDMLNLIARKDDTVWARKVHKQLIQSYLKKQGWKKRRIVAAFGEVQRSLEMVM